MRQANILDPIHETLPESVWDNPGDAKPHLKPQHRKWIVDTVHRVLKDAGYTHIEHWLSLVLTGSLTTYQYGAESDCDVSLFVNAEVFPEWSRAEMIGEMIAHVDGTKLPGTSYPMQCFVVPPDVKQGDLYKPGLRSGYDLQTDKWIEPPDRYRAHDVQREMNNFYVYALEQADKMERLLRYEPDKAVMLWHQIHKKRRRDQQQGKGDYSESNIVYKFLANRGLFPQLSEASGEYIAKQGAYVDHPDYGFIDQDKYNEVAQGLQSFEGTQGAGTVPLAHRPIMWAPISKRLYIGAPGAVHQSLRDEFGHHFKEHDLPFFKGQPDEYFEHGVLTPNNEIGWYGSYPREDSSGRSYEPQAAAIADYLGAKPIQGGKPDVCPKCKGTGADYDVSGGYYHDAQGRCEECHGTGRIRKDEEWHFGAKQRTVTKFVYDPQTNHLVLGITGAEEGEHESHNDLLHKAGLDPASAVFGQIDTKGRVETFGRPLIRGFSQPNMSQYESDYRLKQALEKAIPGVQHDAFVPPHGDWENEGTPQVTYLGAPPTVTPDEQEPLQEGAWSF